MTRRGADAPRPTLPMEALPGRVVLLVPRRADHGWRDRLWDVCRARWERLHPEWPVIEGHHEEGPFSRAAAINRAARDAGDWDIAVVIDADVMLDPAQVRTAVETARAAGKVTWAHRRWAELTEAATTRLLGDPTVLMEPALDFAPADVRKTNPISWSCCMAVPRAVFDALGGFDERFQGWGYEDMAFMSAVVGLHGHERIEGTVWNLWHPRQPGSGRASRDPQGDLTAEAVTSARLGRRYMVALRRDQPDRIESASEVERLKDIRNLQRDDERLAGEAARLGLPDWSSWWPSLEELLSGASPGPSIAVVVHSGGRPEVWEARGAYLERALASVEARLRFPQQPERRVVFSDWGPELHEELTAIAEAHGFYVVGGDRRRGYTGSMGAMWSYLARRSRADLVFQTEDDFVLDRDVDLAPMARTLLADPQLVQMALLRGPVWPSETMPGTILGHPETEFEARSSADGSWLEHRRFFTVNPMLMRRTLTRTAWPGGDHSEARYGRLLFRDGARRAGIWGDGTPWVTHLGDVRAGGPY